MNINPSNSVLALLMAAMATIPNAWGQLSADATRFRADLEKEFNSLKQNLQSALPTSDAGKQSALLKAREAETAAEAKLKAATERRAKYGSAKALVDHAKGKWIADAQRNIAKAKEAVKNAKNADERKAAEAELANWEKNEKEGLAALKEREALLAEAERDKSAAEKAFEEASKQLAEAKAKTMEAVQNVGLSNVLTSNALDARLAKFVVIKEATPAALANFVGRGSEQRGMIERMLNDEKLLIQMLVADGAKDGNYPRAMEILHEIEKASPKAKEGAMQRLALAIALEHASPVAQRNAITAVDAPSTVDPVERYLQYEKAYFGGLLDPAFGELTVWDYRMVVDGEEPNEISVWGREMLRSFRPDHVMMSDYGWRYVALVRSDIPYGSQDVKYDQDDLHFFQNILMNGGICGRRAFIGRFILRAFGIPTIARPQKGHAALAHWTPDGWVINLGAGWGNGWTRTPYRDDRDFLATTQARALGDHFLQVKRARWIGDLMGEKRVLGFHDRDEPGFWHGIALYTQKALIEAADAKTLGPLGEDIAEATESKEKIEVPVAKISDEERKIRIEDGIIRIPAAAVSDADNRGVQLMDSWLGGAQLHYSRGANKATFEYGFQAPRSGKYALVAQIANPTWKQGFLVTVNGNKEPLKMPLPHTVGLWGASEPIEVELNNGRNVLRFERYSDASPKGISIREFVLVPWERRDTVTSLYESENPSQEPRMPAPSREHLTTSLLQDLAQLSSENQLQPLPMTLTISKSTVYLVSASGSSILAFQAMDGDRVAAVAIDDLAIDDHALLSRLVARLKPDDADAHARAALYMTYTAQPVVAEHYRSKAGPEAVARLAAIHENSAN